MRILIQHRETKLFYECALGWVQSADAASNFATPLTAARFSTREELGDTEVVFLRTARPVEPAAKPD